MIGLRKKWKKLIHVKWFPAAAAAVLLCIAAAVYSGVSGQNSILKRGMQAFLLPGQRAATHTAVKVADKYNQLFRYDALKAENEALQKQVAELTAQLEKQQDMAKEAQSLRDLLEFSERNSEFSYAEAEVIGRTLDEWSSVLTIDAGSAEGLAINDPVVTGLGMVGYISALNEHSAQVTTILDSNMSAGVRVIRTGVLAVAQGDYQLMTDERLRVRYLAKDADVVVGDTVETSGTGGVFPKGLMIGTVEQLRTESDGMSDYAVLKPIVDISTLTNVYIITDISYS